MIIVPQLDPSKVRHDLIPVFIEVQTSADIRVVFLRLLRFVASRGLFGEKLLWSSGKDCRLFIHEDGDYDTGDEVNMVPRIVLSGGGGQNRKMGMSGSTSGQTGFGSMKTVTSGTSIVLDITGRDKYEAGRLAELCNDFLDILIPQIKASVTNIDDISGLSWAGARKSSSKSGDPKEWKAGVSFSVEYYKSYEVSRYKGSGKSPHPLYNLGVPLGEADKQSQAYGDNIKPIFSLLDFRVTAGTDDDELVVVHKTFLRDSDGNEPVIPEVMDTPCITSDPAVLEFGEVASGEYSEPLSAVVTPDTDGEQSVTVTLPAGADLDLIHRDELTDILFKVKK